MEAKTIKRRWIIIISVFIILQVYFMLVDGTGYEPRINDSNNFLFETFRAILNSKLFTKWITFYSYPFFNLTTALFIVAIIFQAIHDIYTMTKMRESNESYYF